MEFSKEIATATGYQISVNENEKNNLNSIHLLLNTKNESILGEEGYMLSVTTKGVFIHANKPAGLFYGLQTLLQLLPKEIESKTFIQKSSWTIPAVEITDYPQYKWWGILFDVARHFFTKPQVKVFIDNMVKYKYNMLHLHLTDDQGWRLEIKSLP